MGHRAGRLVGRDAELASLVTAWEAGGRTVVVTGPPGIGKSRLVSALEELVASVPVLRGRATASSGTTPLRPIREALIGASRRGLTPDASLDPYLPALAAVVPEWGPSSGGTPDASLLGEATLRLLAPVGAAVVIIDDVQWADAESLAVLEYLADQIAETRLLLLLTCRDDEATGGVALVKDLVRRRISTEVPLRRLQAAEVVEMAQELVDDEIPRDVVDVLIDRSEGIPFLVEELVGTAISSGWESLAAAVPGTILTSVGLRLDELDDDARGLVVAGALLGRSFDWRMASTAAGLDERATERSLRGAIRIGLIEPDGDSHRFPHGLLRDAVLVAAPPVERERLAQSALRALELTATERWSIDDCLVGAEIAGRCGDLDRASSLLTDAARLALEEGALASAGDYAERAEGCSTSVVTVLLRLEVAARAGHAELARSLGRQLLGEVGDSGALADVHLLLAEAELAAGSWEAAGAHGRKAIALLGKDPERRARAKVVLAEAAMGEDDVAQAGLLATDALADGRRAGRRDIECAALEVLGRIERGRDIAAAEAAFGRALAVATEARLATWRVRALHELGTVDLFTDLRTERLEQAHAEAAALGAVATVALVELQLAALYDERGDLTDALQWARRCEETSHRFGLSTLPMSRAVQAMVHARRGDRHAMDAAIAAARATHADMDYVESGIASQAVAIFHLIGGDLGRAAEQIDRGMEVIRSRPAAVLPYPGLWALVRTVLDDGGDQARAEVAGLPFDTPVSRSTLLAAEAVAAGRRGDAGRAGELFTSSDDWLRRNRGRFRLLLHRTLVAPAAKADHWGEPERWLREALAEAEAADLTAVAGRCRAVMRELGVAVPRRRGGSPVIPPHLAAMGITARELEVLSLLGQGATNRRIAEALFISVRTVDKHVERLLVKTAMSRRELRELARAAGSLRT